MMKKIEPVAFMTYKGYLKHASDPKVKEYDNPEPLYTREALEAVAEQVLIEVANAEGHSLSDWKESVNISSIISRMTGD